MPTSGGRQEYYRTLEADKRGEKKVGKKADKISVEPREDRTLPETTRENQQTEFHIAIEYESALFQTKAGYERFFGSLKFDQPGLSARMDTKIFEPATNFIPTTISMPANVYNAYEKLYEAIPASRRKNGIETAAGWVRSLPLGVTYVTRHIYGLWHCTGGKDPIAREYPLQWFAPYVRSMLRGAVAASRAGDLISSMPIDGRSWAPQTYYPAIAPAAEDGTIADEGQFGGAWSDFKGGFKKGQFVTWSELCGEYEEELLAGEEE